MTPAATVSHFEVKNLQKRYALAIYQDMEGDV